MKLISRALENLKYGSFIKLLLLMKIFSLFFLLTALQCVAATGRAQEKVNLEFKDAPLGRILKSIERQTNYSFFYKSDILSGIRETVSVKNVSIDLVMTEILHKHGLRFRKTGPMLIAIMKGQNDARSALSWVLNGKVFNDAGYPIAGASVSIMGTTRGTSTGNEGEFMIEVQSENDSVVVSAVGYKTKTVVAGSSRTIAIILAEDIEQQRMDEVVVTAFSTKQRKEAVVGSVTAINPGELKVPSSNLTTALAGKISGMIAYQRSGEPGEDNADFFIRGVTTFGYKVNPLILVDNMEISTTDLARLNVDEIASFSIMKDATATALYGARGANGVILITTKEGQEGKAKISFRMESRLSEPTRDVELADPVTYMQLHNEAVITRDPLGLEPYTRDKIAKTADNVDPYLYPATDWREVLMKDNAMNHRFNLSISGGGKVARYFAAGNISQDNGVLRVPRISNFNNNIKLTTASLRTNVNINISKTTELTARLSGTFDDYIGPVSGGTEVYNSIMHTNPALFPPFFQPGENEKYISHIMFGNSGMGTNLNPYADMVKGYREYSRSNMYAQFELKQKLDMLIEGLSFKGLVNTTRNSYFDLSRQYQPFYYEVMDQDPLKGDYQYRLINENVGTEYLDYQEGGKIVNSAFYLETSVNYDRNFNNKHNVSSLLIYTMRNLLDGNTGSLVRSLPFRNVGLSGRATYGYDRRYFAEFNFGYNGSERFSEDKRFGFFPSVGMAWVVSNEKFFEPVYSVISNLKLRATYGLVGNDAIGSADERFFFLSEINMNDGGRAMQFGENYGYRRNGISVINYPNPDITWEVAYKKNLALEMTLLGKLSLVAEVFQERRTNILMPRSFIPTTMGLSATIKANAGEAKSAGVDMSMDYNHSFSRGLWASARANFTYARSEYKVYEEPEYQERYLSRVGYSLSQQWGYIADRLFIDDEEVSNSPLQSFGRYSGGDIKFHDTNGDGQISSLDQVPIGYPTVPEIIYGFGISAGSRSFDLSFFFQGSARSSFWIDPAATSPFQNSTQLLDVYANDHWSEQNRDLYALWPRLTPILSENNTQPSTWFMRNGAFLRLKQVELGYSVPGRSLKQIGLTGLRVYVTGSNLLTFSEFKLWDIEMGGNGLGYPIQRNFSLGVNVNL